MNSIKTILIIFGCLWIAILSCSLFWHLGKKVVTEGLLLNTFKRIAKLTAVAFLLTVCVVIYTFIIHVSIKYDLPRTVMDSLNKETILLSMK